MIEADDAFEHARRAFRNASEAATMGGVRSYVTLGLAYLSRAEELSAVVDKSQSAGPVLTPKLRLQERDRS